MRTTLAFLVLCMSVRATPSHADPGDPDPLSSHPDGGAPRDHGAHAPPAKDGHGGAHGPSALHEHHGAHGRHGNPEDLESYVARLESPDRDAWQKPDEVVKALALRRGQVVCDIGAGPGYFSLRVAAAVGPRGHVYSVDVEPSMVDTLRARLAASPHRNVTPVLALPDDPLLPERACDLVLVVDTFHHFPDGTAYLRHLVRALKPEGRLVNIDFHPRELPVGPPPAHKIAREDFLSQARAAGLELVSEPGFLPYQYFLVLKPR